MRGLWGQSPCGKWAKWPDGKTIAAGRKGRGCCGLRPTFLKEMLPFYGRRGEEYSWGVRRGTGSAWVASGESGRAAGGGGEPVPQSERRTGRSEKIWGIFW